MKNAVCETARRDQERIGWSMAAHGFLSKSWTHLASQDMNIPARLEVQAGGHNRIRSIIAALYGHSSRMWLSRNEVLHSDDESILRDIRSTEVAEIKALYKKPYLLRAGDRHYCQRSLDRLLSGSAATRRRWLRRVRKSIEEYRKDGGRQSVMTSYFSTRSQDHQPR